MTPTQGRIEAVAVFIECLNPIARVDFLLQQIFGHAPTRCFGVGANHFVRSVPLLLELDVYETASKEGLVYGFEILLAGEVDNFIASIFLIQAAGQ